jgi:hypothetical protein
MSCDIKTDIKNAMTSFLKIQLDIYKAYAAVIEEYEESDELGFQQDLYDLRQSRLRSVKQFNERCRKAMSLNWNNLDDLY